jgi:hypothetical protein
MGQAPAGCGVRYIDLVHGWAGCQGYSGHLGAVYTAVDSGLSWRLITP